MPQGEHTMSALIWLVDLVGDKRDRQHNNETDFNVQYHDLAKYFVSRFEGK